MKLIPPDKRQCQGEHQVGAFAMGGRIGERTRCTNKPIVIVTEKRKAKDGRIGSMSLCESCLRVAEKQLGSDFFTVKEIAALKSRKLGKLKTTTVATISEHTINTKHCLDDCGNCAHKFSCKFSRFCKDKSSACMHWECCYSDFSK